MYQCPKLDGGCGKAVCAEKRLTLQSLSDNLAIHIKRFKASFRNGQLRRKKLNTQVRRFWGVV